MTPKLLIDGYRPLPDDKDAQSGQPSGSNGPSVAYTLPPPPRNTTSSVVKPKE